MKQDVIKRYDEKYYLRLTTKSYPDFITMEDSILDNMDNDEFKSFLDQTIENLKNGGSKVYSQTYNRILLKVEKNIAYKSYGTVRFSFVIKGPKKFNTIDAIFRRLKYVETKYSVYMGCSPISNTWIKEEQLLKYIVENRPSKVSNSTYLRIFLLDFYELL